MPLYIYCISKINQIIILFFFLGSYSLSFPLFLLAFLSFPLPLFIPLSIHPSIPPSLHPFLFLFPFLRYDLTLHPKTSLIYMNLTSQSPNCNYMLELPHPHVMYMCTCVCRPKDDVRSILTGSLPETRAH